MRATITPARALSIVTAGLMLTFGLILGTGRASAQDTAVAAHPAHIHSGTCTELGDVIYPLTDVSAEAGSTSGTPGAGHDMGSPMSGDMAASPTSMDAMAGSSDTAMGTPIGTPTGPFGVVIESSVTTVEAALTDLSAGGYAINVHESAENIGNYIACGAITGTPADTGDLTIKLDELNASGYMGTATLHDNGDGTTTVSITLTHGEM